MNFTYSTESCMTFRNMICDIGPLILDKLVKAFGWHPRVMFNASKK